MIGSKYERKTASERVKVMGRGWQEREIDLSKIGPEKGSEGIGIRRQPWHAYLMRDGRPV